MCDAFVEELLKKWGVPQLLERCKEQELDLNGLRSLEEDVITELVPLIGPRCKFRKAWRSWQEAGAPTPTPPDWASPSPAPSVLSAPSSPAPRDAPASAAQPADPGAGTPGTPTQVRRDLGDGEQPGPSDGRKEVSVFLEGKIVYEGDSSTGWLTADGYLSKAGTPTLKIKEEPSDAIPSEMEAESTRLESRHRKGPRFQLQGHISLSVQEFVEVPAFMLSTAVDESPSLPNEPHQFFQQEAADVSPPARASHPSRLAVHDADDPDPLASPGRAHVPANVSVPASTPQPASASAPAAVRTSNRIQARVAKRRRSVPEKLDLEALLNASSRGKMILALYQQKGSLDASTRQALTDLIVGEELSDDASTKITSQRFQAMAEAIVEMFPGENVDTYYGNDRSHPDRPGGKGKLASKYYNMRRQLVKTGIICRGVNRERKLNLQLSTVAALTCSPKEEEVATQSINWLQGLGSRAQPLSPFDVETAVERWRTCWKKRFLMTLSPNHRVTAYLDKFIILRESALGKRLIRSDFELLFKRVGDRLLNMWPSFSLTIINKLSEDNRRAFPILDHMKMHISTDEGKQVAAFLLLPSMLPVTTCRGASETSELWRPTRQEAQDGFLLHVKENGQLSSVLEQHWMRMRGIGQQVCPLPVVVGPSMDKIQAAYVAIDETTLFYAKNTVDAVDLAFKCFHALQVHYPPQAQNVWLFLQHAVYQVSTPADRVSVAVNSLLADFALRPVPFIASWDQVLKNP